MKLLELFSGTGSVGKVATEMGYEVTSLDMVGPATIKINLMHWVYTDLLPGSFDFIWASPPCTEYSMALTTRPRKIDEANEIVKRTIEIIEYFGPRYYIIENPQTGLLKKQLFMDELRYNDIDYCKYGMQYRKRTRLWNNIMNWNPRPLCQKDCGNVEGNKHFATAQRMPSGKKAEWGDKPLFKQSELYVVPADLICEILGAALSNY